MNHALCELPRKIDTRNVTTDGTMCPLPNVWLGTSVEDQARADERIPHLLKCPAAVRFLSVEPLLGSVDLRMPCMTCKGVGFDPERDADPGWPKGSSGATCRACAGRGRYFPAVDWVIVGGESGAESRSMHVEWARSVVRQCRDAKVAVFVKQLGRWPALDALPANGDIAHACCSGMDGQEVAVTREDGETRILDARRSSQWRLGTPGDDLRQHRRLKDPKGGDMAEWPEDLRVREWPKVVAQKVGG